MEIIKKDLETTNWELPESRFDGYNSGGESVNFYLSPHHPVYKSTLVMDIEFILSNFDDNNVLLYSITIPLKSSVIFDIHKTPPSVDELYKIYSEVRPDWINLIAKESLKRKLGTIYIDEPNLSLDKLKPQLIAAIQKTYRLN
jgi:hypothetical protein